MATTKKTTTTKKSNLRHAAALLPLAIGLSMNVARSGQEPPQSASPTTSTASATQFHTTCSLPFKGALNPAIDNVCSITGGSSDPAKQAESASKNNFCSETPTAEALTYQQLLDLQAKSTAAKLKKSITDRKVVEDMGEGKYVSYIALVKEAHYSDVGAGEAVNCNKSGAERNDIHIVLMPEGKTDECESTTAEMSPHFRPAAWTPANIMTASKDHPVRVKGHFFYDGSHSPCTASSRPNPKRASLWEVHPVYSFEICSAKTIAECQASSAEWTPLEK